jgi:hydroxymethylbilane synthase
MKIKIGTRASKLALWQAYHIKDKLEVAGLESEIVEVVTKGDQILDRSLSKIGSKGLFTEELENQLKRGEIDIAVHSAKDLSSSLEPGFEILAFTEREKAHDVFLSHKKDLNLAHNLTVGTSSTRRVALLKSLYPYFEIVDMRGNLQTRIAKMLAGHCDILLLAYAGVHRMEYDDRIIKHLDIETFCPPVGQGVLAIECHQSLEASIKVKIKDILEHPETAADMKIERAFLNYINGGCSIPVFAHVFKKDEKKYFKAGIIKLDGSEAISFTENVNEASIENLGVKMAEKLLSSGGKEILDEIKQNLQS